MRLYYESLSPCIAQLNALKLTETIIYSPSGQSGTPTERHCSLPYVLNIAM